MAFSAGSRLCQGLVFPILYLPLYDVFTWLTNLNNLHFCYFLLLWILAVPKSIECYLVPVLWRSVLCVSLLRAHLEYLNQLTF